MKFVVNLQQINKTTLLFGRATEQCGSVLSKLPFVRGKFATFGYPMKHNLKDPLINSPVSGHPPYFSLVSAYGNNSRKRTVLLTDTFFSSRGCPLTRGES